ncbi:MAG: lipopolysaccharide/colanic/teichoic acid biosynthesis glycosyltransferase [Candidatus Aldehydirespiratoraceae bacterium]
MLTRRLSFLATYGGIVLVVLGLSKAHAALIASPPYDLSQSFRLPWAVVFSVFLAVAAYAVGLPDVPRRARQITAASVAAVLMAAGAVSAVQLVAGSVPVPRFVIVGASAALVPWFAATAVLSARGHDRARGLDRAVIIGAQEDSAGLVNEFDAASERPGQVVAFLHPDDARPSSEDRMPVRTAVEAHDATVVVLDRDAQACQPIVDQVALLHEQGVRVRTLSLFYEQWLGKLPIGELERVSLMFDIGEIHRLRYSRVKRLMDVSVAVVMLPLLAVVMPLVFLGNAIGNRGPLFFHQDRVGKGGVVFRIHKFRTMRATAADEATPWTDTDDDRVTAFGAVLRSSHVDELPQLLNILRGDLSLVGPRPEQPHYVEQLEAKLPYYQLRHLVQPGLTGWAQVKFRYARSEADALEKLQYEFYYLRHQALAVDLRIVVRTMRTILPMGVNRWH